MNSVRTIVAIPAILTFVLALGAQTGCKPSTPDGTTPPGEGDDDGGGKGLFGKRKKGSKGGEDGGDGDGGSETAKADAAKECPPEISDTPAALFPDPETGKPQAFIRVPKGMENDDLVEQMPFFFRTMNQEGFVSTCEALVNFMAVGFLADQPDKPFEEVRDFILKDNLQYEVESYEDTTVEGRMFKGVANIAPSQANKNEGSKAWIYMENKYGAGQVFFVVLEAHPNAFEAILPTFEAVTDSLIVVPPEGG